MVLDCIHYKIKANFSANTLITDKIPIFDVLLLHV